MEFTPHVEETPNCISTERRYVEKGGGGERALRI